MNAASAYGKEHLFRGLGRMTDMIMKQGKGSYIWATPAAEADASQYPAEGRRFLDFTSGIGVTNLGHCHPNIVAAVQEQAGKLCHAQVNIAMSEPVVDLLQQLASIAPHPSLDSFLLWNSGAECVEAAVKLARHATQRPNIIVMQGSYHGRTSLTMTMTRSKTIYSAGFGPYPSGIYVTPFPYAGQMGLKSQANADALGIDLSEQCLYQLELLLAQQTAPKDTAAIILEPVLGEGGYVPAPPAFLHGLREICDREGILLITDEVQSGFGRTGKMFCGEHSGVRPDIVTLAKGLGNGFPISAVMTRKELADKQPPGSQGGTYAANPVSCAAASAVIKTFKQDGVLDNVNARSAQIFRALKDLQENTNLIVDVRGMGLMVGIEFVGAPHTGGLPPKMQKAADALPKNVAARVQAKCLEKGMLTLTTSAFEVMRLIPPLIITEQELAEGIEIFKQAVLDVAKEG